VPPRIGYTRQRRRRCTRWSSRRPTGHSRSDRDHRSPDRRCPRRLRSRRSCRHSTPRRGRRSSADVVRARVAGTAGARTAGLAGATAGLTDVGTQVPAPHSAGAARLAQRSAHGATVGPWPSTLPSSRPVRASRTRCRRSHTQPGTVSRTKAKRFMAPRRCIACAVGQATGFAGFDQLERGRLCKRRTAAAARLCSAGQDRGGALPPGLRGQALAHAAAALEGAHETKGSSVHDVALCAKREPPRKACGFGAGNPAWLDPPCPVFFQWLRDVARRRRSPGGHGGIVAVPPGTEDDMRRFGILLALTIVAAGCEGPEGAVGPAGTRAAWGPGSRRPGRRDGANGAIDRPVLRVQPVHPVQPVPARRTGSRHRRSRATPSTAGSCPTMSRSRTTRTRCSGGCRTAVTRARGTDYLRYNRRRLEERGRRSPRRGGDPGGQRKAGRDERPLTIYRAAHVDDVQRSTAARMPTTSASSAAS